MRRRNLSGIFMIGLIAIVLGGCGQATKKSQTKPKPVSFAKIVNENQQHIWYETSGKNVTKNSEITYLLVTKNGRVTVYTVKASLGKYNRFSTRHAIKMAKRADWDAFENSRQTAHNDSTQKQIELEQKLKSGKAKSASKRNQIRTAITQLKDRRWNIETAKYEAPRPQPYQAKLTLKDGKVKGEQVIYQYHDYADYMNQFTDADSWIKHDQLGVKAKPIKPLSAFFTDTDGAKTVYKHRFHIAVTPVIDNYVGYLEHKQIQGKKLKKMTKANKLKKGNSLLYRVRDKKTSTAFDHQSSQHVQIK